MIIIDISSNYDLNWMKTKKYAALIWLWENILFEEKLRKLYQFIQSDFVDGATQKHAYTWILRQIGTLVLIEIGMVTSALNPLLKFVKM